MFVMQKVERQHFDPQKHGCINKKAICSILKPHLAGYSSRTVQSFFTAERLQRLALTPEQIKELRGFTPEQTAVIVGDLRRCGLLPD